MSMEEIISIRPFFIFFSISSIALCSQLISGSTSSRLDVSASLDAATRAISYQADHDPDQDLREGAGGTAEERAQPSSSSSTTHRITLEVYSRDFLPFPIASSSHKDYRSLTLARLRRDSARVEAIASKVAATYRSTADLRGPIVSGTSHGSGEYLSRVEIGTPPRPQYMVLDTGSDVSWVQCQPCRDCYKQSDPVFDPSASTSYSLLSCTSDRCRSLDVSGCRNSSSCIYQVTYGDGSTTVGDLANETLTLGDSAPVPGVALGCGHDNEGLFVGASGILGLGMGALSLPSQISARSISYCLVDRDSPKASTLQLGLAGGNDEIGLVTSTATAPLLRNEKMGTFYYVGMSGISVGGEMLRTASMGRKGGRERWGDLGLGDTGDEAAQRGVRGRPGRVRDEDEGPAIDARGAAVRHVLQPVVPEEEGGGGAGGVVPLHGGRGAEAAGEELPDPGGLRGDILPGLRAHQLIRVHRRQRAAAGDACDHRSG